MDRSVNLFGVIGVVSPGGSQFVLGQRFLVPASNGVIVHPKLACAHKHPHRDASRPNTGFPTHDIRGLTDKFWHSAPKAKPISGYLLHHKAHSYACTDS